MKYFTHEIINSVETFDTRDLIDRDLTDIITAIKRDDFPVFHLLHSLDGVRKIEEFAGRISSNFNKFVICGIGGSSLGTKAIIDLIGKKNFWFLESIDPDSVSNFFAENDISDMAFIIISKSGETVETVVNSLIILDQLKNRGLNPQKNLFCLTENSDNTIRKLTKEFGIANFDLPKNVSGRFSYLTATILVPLALAGLSIKNLVEVTRDFIDSWEEYRQYWIDSVGMQDMIFKSYINTNIFVTYGDILTNFNYWYNQLFSESLGKNGFPTLSVSSFGTVDQHSKLQLYIDGKSDKFFTFINRKNYKNDFTIKSNLVKVFDGRKLSYVFNSEFNSTIKILTQGGKPIRILELNEIDANSVTVMMGFFTIEILLLAKRFSLEPFSQPAVERRKKLVFDEYYNL